MKLCVQEKEKLLKIKELVNQREEMHSTINSMLDNQSQKPARPSTAKPKVSKNIDFKNDDFKIMVGSSAMNKDDDDNAINCKI